MMAACPGRCSSTSAHCAAPALCGRCLAARSSPSSAPRWPPWRGVGLVSLAGLVPLLAGSLLGGSIVDAVDRRRLLIAVSVISAVVTAGLAVNASSRPSLWPIFVCAPLAAGLGTFEDSALGAVVPILVRLSDVPAVSAMFQALFQFGLVVGPALAGLLLAGTGVRFVYWIDSATFAAAAAAALAIAPQPPAGGGQPPP